MTAIIPCEWMKLKRCSVLWVGVVTLIFSAALAVSQSASDAGAQPTYEQFANFIIWNNFSLAFPFLIVLLGGFLIDREYTDDALKAMLTVPVPYGKMVLGKLIVTALLTLLFACFSFVCTLFSAGVVLRCVGMTPFSIWKSFCQIESIAFFNFLAVAPLIAWFSRKRGGYFTGVIIAFFYGICGIFVAGRNLSDFYPITAGLGIAGYAGNPGAVYHPVVGGCVLAVMVVLTAGIVARPLAYDAVMLPSQTKARQKKGQSKQ